MTPEQHKWYWKGFNDAKAQPEQGCDYCNHSLYAGTICKNCGKVTSQPEQHTWVNATTWRGLTDDEIATEATKEEQAYGFIQGVAWAEAKLKEKNFS